MSGMVLYNVLTKLGATPEEAKEAIADVASSKEIAAKIAVTEIKAELRGDMSELKGDIRELRIELKYLRWLIVVVVGIAIAIIKYL